MEHLETDMDDLFQKAGELYPLKTTGSDWDAVAGKLQSEDPGEIHDLTGGTVIPTRRRTWLLLLLLIPLALGVFYFSGSVNQGHQTTVSVKPLSGSDDQNKTNSMVPDNRAVPAGAADNSKTDNNKTAGSDNSQMESGRKNHAENSGTNGTISSKNRKLSYAVAGRKQLNADNTLNSHNQTSSFSDRTSSDLNSNHLNQGSTETKTVAANNAMSNASSAVESVPKAAVAVVPPAVATQNETTAIKNNTDKTESSKNASPDSSQAKKKPNTTSKQSKGFYVGLFAGPDVSTVKFQPVNNLGFSLGALIGYRFNNRLSVETGVTWDKKYYYSNGEDRKSVV